VSNDRETVLAQLKAAQGALYAASIAVEHAIELMEEPAPEPVPESIKRLQEPVVVETMGGVIHNVQ
jgi:hypothetical protein